SSHDEPFKLERGILKDLTTEELPSLAVVQPADPVSTGLPLAEADLPAGQADFDQLAVARMQAIRTQNTVDQNVLTDAGIATITLEEYKVRFGNNARHSRAITPTLTRSRAA